MAIWPQIQLNAWTPFLRELMVDFSFGKGNLGKNKNMMCGTRVEDRHDVTHMTLLWRRYHNLTKKKSTNLNYVFCAKV